MAPLEDFIKNEAFVAAYKIAVTNPDFVRGFDVLKSTFNRPSAPSGIRIQGVSPDQAAAYLLGVMVGRSEVFDSIQYLADGASAVEHIEETYETSETDENNGSKK